MTTAVPPTIQSLLNQIATLNSNAALELERVLTSTSLDPSQKMLKVQRIAEDRNLSVAVWEAVKKILEMLSSTTR